MPTSESTPTLSVILILHQNAEQPLRPLCGSERMRRFRVISWDYSIARPRLLTLRSALHPTIWRRVQTSREGTIFVLRAYKPLQPRSAAGISPRYTPPPADAGLAGVLGSQSLVCQQHRARQDIYLRTPEGAEEYPSGPLLTV